MKKLQVRGAIICRSAIFFISKCLEREFPKSPKSNLKSHLERDIPRDLWVNLFYIISIILILPTIPVRNRIRNGYQERDRWNVRFLILSVERNAIESKAVRGAPKPATREYKYTERVLLRGWQKSQPVSSPAYGKRYLFSARAFIRSRRAVS